MALSALTSGHQLGLGLSVLVFAGFSLIVSMVVPRRWPQFPGRLLPAFVVVVILLFLGMLAAVIVFGREKGEAASAAAETSTTAATSTTTTTSATSTSSSGGPSAQQVAVKEVEFKIELPKTTLSAGTYTFAVSNDGKVPHDLVVSGPGGKKGTPTISPGSSASLTVTLQKGQYDFYCSVPGHKAAGMDQKVTVS